MWPERRWQWEGVTIGLENGFVRIFRAVRLSVGCPCSLPAITPTLTLTVRIPYYIIYAYRSSGGRASGELYR